MNISAYTRPNKPKFLHVKKRLDYQLTSVDKNAVINITVDKSTECHVTPLAVAARMVEYANPVQGEDFLEPHAGTGNIVNEMINLGVKTENVTFVEKNISLFNFCKSRFDSAINGVNSCFIEYAKATENRFDSIIMNPPFSKAKHHFESAISLLKAGGCLIALVPVAFEFDGITELEKLPDSTFSTTNVKTKIVCYYT